jgi:hypothetical protein
MIIKKKIGVRISKNKILLITILLNHFKSNNLKVVFLYIIQEEKYQKVFYLLFLYFISGNS